MSMASGDQILQWAAATSVWDIRHVKANALLFFDDVVRYLF
ncbi:hypothetical protein [Roseimaritima sediminicola]|nr:hypothetical protein [Roseimaritima sediminicola]